MAESLHNVSYLATPPLQREASGLDRAGNREAKRRGWRVVASSGAVQAAGIYAVYHDGLLVYIGSSTFLPNRIHSYLNTPKPHALSRKSSNRINGGPRRPTSDDVVVTLKVAPSHRQGDWLMREYRLIRRLKPRDNRVYTGTLMPRKESLRRPRLKPCLGCDGGHWDIHELIACEKAHGRYPSGQLGRRKSPNAPRVEGVA